MEIKIFDTQDILAQAAASQIAAQILEKSDCVLGLATGSSPIKTYEELVRLYKNGVLSFEKVRSFNLDEYKDLPVEHYESYHSFMARNLFDHVDQPASQRFILDGLASDPEAECEAFELKMEALGGVDLQLLGIGQNGHIGFNEPDTVFLSKTHVVDLTQNTIEANARFFDHIDEVPKQALSMGIGSIMKAKKVLLIATGAAKADAVTKMVYGPIDPNCPASILQVHPNCTVLLDKEAASKL